MPPKKTAKKRSASASPAEGPKHVFVLTRESWDHGANYGQGPDKDIMGIYASKEIAAEIAGTLDSQCLGTFEEALQEYRDREEYEIDEDDEDGPVFDRRSNPPNNGVLMKAGCSDLGEGDYVMLTIAQFPVISTSNLSPASKSKKKQRK